MIIAIDGPSGAGKGTLGKALAQKYQLIHVDTGLLYRIVGFNSHRDGVDISDKKAVAKIAGSTDLSDFDNPDLRSEETAKRASVVSAYPQVRATLLTWTRDFVARIPEAYPGVYKGAVLDGRDIGTVVFPRANVKLYITASSHARATRRVNQLQQSGMPAEFDAILYAINERDARDINRPDSPLIPASDSCIIDTTEMTANDVYEKACAYIATRVDAEISPRG